VNDYRKKTSIIILVIGILVFLWINTLVHEFGHYLMAKKLGYDGQLTLGISGFGFLLDRATENKTDSVLIGISGIIFGMILPLFMLVANKTKYYLEVMAWGEIFNMAADLIRLGNDWIYLSEDLSLNPIIFRIIGLISLSIIWPKLSNAFNQYLTNKSSE